MLLFTLESAAFCNIFFIYDTSLASNCVENVIDSLRKGDTKKVSPFIATVPIHEVHNCKNTEQLLVFPIFTVHSTKQNHLFRQLFISFSKKISHIFEATLPCQLGNQPDMPCFYKISQALFSQGEVPLPLMVLLKNLRMICLGNTQIKIPVKLLSA